MKTLLEQLLQALNVPYTHKYTRKAYLQHPDRNNLWGISRLLNAYGIENVSIAIDDKDKLSKLSFPLLAEFSQDLAIVLKATPKETHLVWRNEQIRIPTEQFKQSWSGVATLLQKGNAAKEPFYKQHRHKELCRWISYSLMIALTLVALLYGWCIQGESKSELNVCLLALNAFGTFISCLLVRQSVRTGDGIMDKLCSLFTKANCHQVLDSDEASIYGFHWSEVGFSFFLTNLAISCWLPSVSATWMPWAFAITLPFTIWSVWTQASKLKSWCMLCLTTLAILWGGTFLCICTGDYSTWSFPSNRWIQACVYLGIYVFALLSTHAIIGIWKQSKSTIPLRYMLNRFRSDAAIFETKLNESTLHEWTADFHPLVLAEGTSEKPIITIVSNPFCQPCSLLHQRLEPLRAEGFRIQYVLTTFNESLFAINERISAYAEIHPAEDLWKLMNEWFAEGRKNPVEFWRQKQIAITNEARQRATSHYNWCLEQKFYSTPTILINNRLFPDLYEVEDIIQIYSA